MLKQVSLGVLFGWLLFFVVLPTCILLILSFLYHHITPPFENPYRFSLENYWRLLEPGYLRILGRSFLYGLLTSLICFLLGYPLAYFVSGKKKSVQQLLLILLVIPIWMNIILRIYAWMAILGENSLFNSFLFSLGLPKLNILYTPWAVLLGMVYDFLPFMLLPIYTSCQKVPPVLKEASQDLGASSIKTFFQVVFPLTLDGVFSGITLVFLPAMTYFVISDLLGGKKVMLIGNLIEQELVVLGNWNFASAAAILLTLVVLGMTFVFNRITRRFSP